LTREVLEVMKRLAREGMTMLVVTHEMGFACSVANEVLFMENGVVVEQGSPDLLLHDPRYTRMKDFIGRLDTSRGD
jgi:polar amino acid transport system ATP-binding protein